MKRSVMILVIILVIIEITATYLMYKSSINKEVKLDDVELKEIDSKSSMAMIMVETEEGEYTKEPTWPKEYNFNSEKSVCISEKGEEVKGILTFDEEENKAYVNDIKEGTYCYLYFDLQKQ